MTTLFGTLTSSPAENGDMQSNLSVVGNLVNFAATFASTALFVGAVQCKLAAGTPFWVSAGACLVGLIAFSTAAEPDDAAEADGFKAFSDAEAT